MQNSAAARTDIFFRHLVGNMQNGVFAITSDGAVVLVNAEASRLFGLPPGPTLVGLPYGQVLRQHPDIVRVLSGAFGMATLPNRAELRLKSTNTVIGHTLSLVRDSAGETVGAALFFKDLTQIEQLEERDRLRDRLAAVGEMAAVMAHEIKNPLAGIQVLAGLLRRRAAQDPAAQGLVDDILKEAKMANAIVQEVLAFVRPVRLQMDQTSLADAIASAVAMADSETDRGAIVVDVDVPADLPTLDADRHQLTQVFVNLVINAYQALEGHGHVGVSVRLVRTGPDGALLPDGAQPVDTILVDVTDTGPGVPTQLAEKIFSPFFTTKQKGSGLGLAIVRKIIDAHDGRIDVTSAAGQGTRFRVTLPLRSASAAADAPHQPGVTSGATRGN